MRQFSILTICLLSGISTIPGNTHKSPAASAASMVDTSRVASVESNLPRSRLGLDINAFETDLQTLRTRLDQMKDAGVGIVSAGAVWWYMCPKKGSCSYAALDRLVAEASARELKVTLHVSGVPDWVHPDLAGLRPFDRWWALPRNDVELSHFQKFVRATAKRYRGRVARYEIWNEPNLREFSFPQPSPARFARTLEAGYRGVKSGDPGAIVVSGGLSRADVGFARALLDELRKMPGAARHRLYFDEFGIHPYSDADSPLYSSSSKVHQGPYGPVNNNFDGITDIIALLDAYGQRDKKLWMGEYGFSTRQTWMKAVPDSRRAIYLMMAIDRLRKWRRVSGMVWYSFVPHSATSPEWAIMSTAGTPSQTFLALHAKQSNAPGTGRSSPCAGVVLTGTHTWSARCVPGSHPGHSGFEVYVDGALASAGAGRNARLDTRRLSNGKHRVTIAHVGPSRTPVYTTDVVHRVRN